MMNFLINDFYSSVSSFATLFQGKQIILSYLRFYLTKAFSVQKKRQRKPLPASYLCRVLSLPLVPCWPNPIFTLLPTYGILKVDSAAGCPMPFLPMADVGKASTLGFIPERYRCRGRAGRSQILIVVLYNM